MSPKVLELADIMRLEVKRPETIVEDIVPTPGCTLVVGREKTGKTLLAVQLGMSVATGKPLFDNYRITNPGPVMFVEVDDPAGAASLRLKLLEHVGHDQSAPVRFIEKMSKLSFCRAIRESQSEQSIRFNASATASGCALGIQAACAAHGRRLGRNPSHGCS